jgi:hypothetical protein
MCKVNIRDPKSRLVSSHVKGTERKTKTRALQPNPHDEIHPHRRPVSEERRQQEPSRRIELAFILSSLLSDTYSVNLDLSPE